MKNNEKRLENLKNKIGFFCLVDYTINEKTFSSKGRLTAVYESGILVLENNQNLTEVLLDSVVALKLEPFREYNGGGAQ